MNNIGKTIWPVLSTISFLTDHYGRSIGEKVISLLNHKPDL